MHICIIFIILLQNYEKAVHAHYYRFFCRDCVILLQLNGSKAGLFKENLFGVDQYYSPNLLIGRTNPIIYLNTISQQPI